MIWLRGSEMDPLLRAAHRLVAALRDERSWWRGMRAAVDNLGRITGSRGGHRR